MNESQECSNFAQFRPLSQIEREILIKNGNYAQSWDMDQSF